MKMLIRFALFSLFTLISFPVWAEAPTVTGAPKPSEDSPTVDDFGLPAWILEKKGYYSVSAGYLQLPTPSDAVHLAQIDLNYLYVDQGLAHLFQLRLGLNARSQALAVGYGLGLGRRRGDIHVGLLVNLGYAHLWDDKTQKDVHAMTLGISPTLMGTLWANWQFFLSAGWSMVPLSSSPIPDGRGFGGFNIGFGVGASVD